MCAVTIHLYICANMEKDLRVSKSQSEEAKSKSAAKIDPSFKSKRYRDKLRAEVKSLESLVPVDRPALHRKLDSQTVYRLAIAFLRIKAFFQDKGLYSEKVTDGSENRHDNCNTEKRLDASEPSKDNSVLDSDGERRLLQAVNLTQLCDGFLLVASVDGTIMFVSDNVQQITGFNQVDLIHRCLYGTIHPDDQSDVRDVLEHDGVFSYRPQVPGTKPSRKKARKLFREEGVEPIPLAFFCRMKCFSANTAGYLKLHCTGKIEATTHLPKSIKTSDRVALLYCRPFSVTGCDVQQDAKQNVFWSKHDLDLTINDIETKCTDALGYDREDLCSKSLYQFVHPEDLCIVTHVHKSIMEVNEVQSFYFRFQDKDGAWKWMLSKGKVICKNSKKFSVVFTHCPLRDTDSTFLRQESNLREKYGMADLLNMCAARRGRGHHEQIGQYFNSSDGDNSYSNDAAINSARIRRESTTLPHASKHLLDTSCCHSNNEVASIFSTLIPGPCPSTWHANLDRHSPVVPSNHVAHKLSVRERHLQLADYRRKHEAAQQQYVHRRNGFFGDEIPINDRFHHQRNPAEIIYHPYGYPINEWPHNPDYNTYMHHASSVFPQPDPPEMYTHVPQSEAHHDGDGCFRYVDFRLSEPFHYPPSPPPSPQGRHPPWNPSSSQVSPRDVHHQTQQIIPIGLPHGECQVYNGSTSGFGPGYKGFVRARADVKVSMMYCPRADEENGVVLNRNNGAVPNSHFSYNSVLPSCAKFKDEPNPSKFSCAVSRKPQQSRNDRTCAYETSLHMHMQIVDDEAGADSGRPDIELPLTGSFMDYLTSE